MRVSIKGSLHVTEAASGEGVVVDLDELHEELERILFDARRLRMTIKGETEDSEIALCSIELEVTHA